ncbi:TetR/AcrR family transcriptional regulator [Nocardia sp. NBC_00508]|uniref:TetR/AcrR family transcriptional regulator n=1 Tax=Nocardia sp. NBC_00508 TaxID=2975992 RepID=UPI002E81B471|nr:TetR/AcrR family transcriptional regulator [Nocardia sp. NBC_00508]WUD64165.1 TetR/AcrR family transcriptional regulator [Nocardia sp. NBC_00508]
MTAGPRTRLIDSAIELVREQGVHAAGLAALLERSNASRNSLYQHFPSGKSELVETATRVAGDRIGAVIDKITPGPPQRWFGSLLEWWITTLEKTGYRAGCPVVGAALAESEPRVQAAAGAVFADWHQRLGAALTAAGLSAEDARSFSSFAFSAMEGAIVQARAMKSTRPLEDAQRHLTLLLENYLDEPPAREPGPRPID